jgi:hypothetical protein
VNACYKLYILRGLVKRQLLLQTNINILTTNAPPKIHIFLISSILASGCQLWRKDFGLLRRRSQQIRQHLLGLLDEASRTDTPRRLQLRQIKKVKNQAELWIFQATHRVREETLRIEYCQDDFQRTGADGNTGRLRL